MDHAVAESTTTLQRLAGRKLHPKEVRIDLSVGMVDASFPRRRTCDAAVCQFQVGH